MAAYDAITLAEAKEALRIEGTNGDEHLQRLITGLTLELERRLGTQFVQRAVVEYRPGNCRTIYPNVTPVVSVTTIVDTQSTPVTVSSKDYTIRQRRWLEGYFPTAYDVNGRVSDWTITYVAGWFASTSLVAQDVKEQMVRILNAVRTSPDTATSTEETSAESVKVGDLSISYGAPSSSSSSSSSGGFPATMLDGAAEALFAYRGAWL